MGAKEDGWRGLVGREQSSATEAHGGEGAVARGEWQEVAGWLRKVTAKLTKVSR